MKSLSPRLLIIDSIQTIFSDALDSAPGSLSQVRECASLLLKFAKQSGTPVVLIGHITKEGSLADPRCWSISWTRCCSSRVTSTTCTGYCAIKNRFGSTAELGIYEMNQSGLREVSNPSELLLTQNHEGLSGVSIAAAIEGIRPFLIETQALVSSAAYGTPNGRPPASISAG